VGDVIRGYEGVITAVPRFIGDRAKLDDQGESGQRKPAAKRRSTKK
jgi:hypothetical protein